MRNEIRVKPHHFIDFLTAIGEGKVVFKPHPSGHADFLIAHKIAKNPRQALKIVLDVDDVCFPCKFHLQGTCKGVIDTAFLPNDPSSRQPLTQIIDRRWCDRLRIQNQDTFSAIDLCLRIRDFSGDITGIYAEIPSENAAKRVRNLSAGVDAFLDYAASLNSC